MAIARRRKDAASKAAPPDNWPTAGFSAFGRFGTRSGLTKQRLTK
jgi:hypothetical protein